MTAFIRWMGDIEVSKSEKNGTEVTAWRCRIKIPTMYVGNQIVSKHKELLKQSGVLAKSKTVSGLDQKPSAGKFSTGHSK